MSLDPALKSPPIPTLADVLKMDEQSLADLVTCKFLKHTPCKIRFSSKPRQSSTGNFITMDDQTGVLFGCKYTGNRQKPFELGIYFRDPLEFRKNTSGYSISVLNRSQRQFKVFCGSSFLSTCYYNWDEFKTNCTMYKKDTYNFTEIQLIPGDESSWQKTTNVFPFASRNWKTKESIHKFLAGGLPQPLRNEALCGALPLEDCDPIHFNPIRGRSSIKGRGLDEIVDSQPMSRDTQHKRSRSVNSGKQGPHRYRIVCPGCQRYIKQTLEDNGYDVDNSHQTQDCCGIQVCKV